MRRPAATVGCFVVATAMVLTAALALPPAAAPAAAATGDAPTCSTAGTWRHGELNIYWFDVEQGDSQLLVGPAGRTMLIDLGERAYNATSDTMSARVADEIRRICGIGSGPVHLDYVMASHHHLDHIGYAGNPNDTSSYGNGIYRLLHPSGEAFTVGTLIDRDGGAWTDSNGDGDCDVGTSSNPSDEIDWHHAGTVSQTARRWICWLYGPAGAPDRSHVDGRVLTLRNDTAWPALDLGTGVDVRILQANAKGVMQADGVTPVSGDHTAESVPPSENDYSIAVGVAYGDYAYATAGDSDGEYATSSYGYSYNDIEASLAGPFGNVDTVRANHHGSGHSSSGGYVNALDPETSVISCGANSYGHPANRVLDAFRAVGADIYLTNNPCDTTDGTGAAIDYGGTLNQDGRVWLATSDGGGGYDVVFDAGSRSYVASSGAGPAGPEAIRINEFLMAPSSGGSEWVELVNPTSSEIDIGGLYIDDVADGGGSPRQIAAGTSVAPGARHVVEFASGFLNNTGSESVRFVAISGGSETVYDSYSYTLASARYDQVFHRIGDAGDWCDTISSNTTKGTANPSTCP